MTANEVPAGWTESTLRVPLTGKDGAAVEPRVTALLKIAYPRDAIVEIEPRFTDLTHTRRLVADIDGRLWSAMAQVEGCPSQGDIGRVQHGPHQITFDFPAKG